MPDPEEAMQRRMGEGWLPALRTQGAQVPVGVTRNASHQTPHGCGAALVRYRLSAGAQAGASHAGAVLSPFEFFFSFYGLLLGFSVAELVNGFARMVHERENVRFGWLTPLLAVFVALDMITFWNQAWTIFRFAPYNMFLLTVGLVVAGVFYLAATLVFPRKVMPGASLDGHFWQHRRLVMLGVLAANWIVAGLFLVNAAISGELEQLNLPPLF